MLRRARSMDFCALAKLHHSEAWNFAYCEGSSPGSMEFLRIAKFRRTGSAKFPRVSEVPPRRKKIFTRNV